jgi:hypothetical protein
VPAWPISNRKILLRILTQCEPTTSTQLHLLERQDNAGVEQALVSCKTTQWRQAL